MEGEAMGRAASMVRRAWLSRQARAVLLGRLPAGETSRGCAWRQVLTVVRRCIANRHARKVRSNAATRLERNMRMIISVRSSAATRLERNMRMMLARRALFRRRLMRPREMVRAWQGQRERAAYIIQRFWSTSHDRGVIHASMLRTAHRRITLAARCFLARKRFYERRRFVAVRKISELFIGRALFIQVLKDRRRLRPTLMLQRNVRLLLARRAVTRLHAPIVARTLHREEIQREAAFVLVTAWRSRLAKWRVRRQRWEVVGKPLLRRAILGWRARRAFKMTSNYAAFLHLSSSATLLQSAARLHFARLTINTRRVACATLKRVGRGLAARGLLEVRRGGGMAARGIQGAWKGHLARRDVREGRAVFVLERAVLSALARRAVGRLQAETNLREAAAAAGVAPGGVCLHCLAKFALSRDEDGVALVPDEDSLTAMFGPCQAAELMHAPGAVLGGVSAGLSSLLSGPGALSAPKEGSEPVSGKLHAPGAIGLSPLGEVSAGLSSLLSGPGALPVSPPQGVIPGGGPVSASLGLLNDAASHVEVGGQWGASIA
ncbi:hypothetical protein T484DRAFT_1890242, partial [Baffinella frigidus]